MNERLTTLAAVRDWLDIPEEQVVSDASLVRLIDAASQFILNYLSRDSFGAVQYTQNFRGNGRMTVLLRNWPILSVSSVGILGTLISPSVLGIAGLPGSGYTIGDPRLGPQSIDLYGYGFYYNAPCQIIYKAGYETTDTSILVAPETPGDTIHYTPMSTGQWINDLGVTLDGVAALKVLSDTPAAGEYSVDEWGTYAFNEDDADAVAVIRYSYVPFDVSFAVVQLIGEWWRRKDRIGVLSKTLGGQETITFSQKDMTESITMLLNDYKSVVPV